MFGSHWFHRNIPYLLTAIVVVSLFGSLTAPADGQFGQTRVGRNQFPAQRYYNSFFQFYSGEYSRAARDFERGGLRIGQNRFIDGVCYSTMLGECNYHMGNYPAALAAYEDALKLMMGYSKNKWQDNVNTVEIQQDTAAIQQAKVTWHRSNRTRVGNIPDSFSMLFGRLDAERALVEGGVIENAEYKQVDVAEVMRCASLAIYRRHQIKGAIAEVDPFTTELISTLKIGTRVGTAFGQWNRVLIGLAHASSGRADNAKGSLTRGLTLTNGMDHQLTSIALLGLARISLAEGKLAEAKTLALEASVSAAVFQQPDMIEETISLATTIHLRENKTEFRPLVGVLEWAAREDTNLLHASTLRLMAECLTEAGKADAARNVIGRARKPMARTDLGNAVVGTRLRYLSAVADYIAGDEAKGEKALGQALDRFAKAGSKWVYQLGLTKRLVDSGNIATRQADILYQRLLRDPTGSEWQTDPLESLTFLLTPHVGLMENWFEILVARKNIDAAIDVSELIRRHRFFAALPLGGRLLSFRWLLNAPDRAMSQDALSQRKSFFRAHPEFKKLADQSDSVIKQLKTLPLKPDAGSPEAKQQKDLFLGLFKNSKTMETYLRSVSLRRVPAEMVFPPVSTFSDIKAQMNSNQIALVSLKTSNGYHQFAINQQNRRYLGLVRERDVRKGVSSVLKGIGVTDRNGPIDVKTIEDTDWKKAAAKLRENIFPEVQDDQWEQYQELVVVPDGLLWYLPFEILQTGGDDALKNLGDRIKIRYSPTINLAYAPLRPSRGLNRAATVVDRFHPKGEPEDSLRAFEDLKNEMPGVTQFDGRVAYPSNLIGAVADQVISFLDLPGSNRDGAMALRPVQLDNTKKGKPLDGSDLAGWMMFPFDGPENVVLPGHSAGGAAGVKKQDGEDLFLTTTSLLASGVRTIMISRWRAGGPNSLALARKFAVSSQTKPAIDALIESTAAARQMELDLDAEPRVKSAALVTALKADHPFFWAGNMLVEIPDDRPAPQTNNIDPLNPNPLDEDANVDSDDVDAKDDEEDAENPEPATDDDNTETPEPATEGAEPDSSGSGTKESDEKESTEEKPSVTESTEKEPVEKPTEKEPGKEKTEEGSGSRG